MEAFLAQPVVAYVAFVAATSLALVEAALPTDGVAGLAAVVFAVIGVASVVVGGLVVWPLALACCGAAAWVVLLAIRRRSTVAEAVAAAVFAAGSLAFALFGAGAGDGADVVVLLVAIAASVGLAVGFVPLHRAAMRLRGRQDEVGMAALVGRTVEVRFWDGTSGTVIIDGAFWNADGPDGLAPGDRVEVLYFEGMQLHVSDAIGKNPTRDGATRHSSD